MNRDQIDAELAAAQVDVGQADARLWAADALDEVTSQPGLRYAPAAADGSVYFVGCDGQLIGRMWPGEQGALFGGWTYAARGAGDRTGPYQTARACAAALADATGRPPRHVMPEV